MATGAAPDSLPGWHAGVVEIAGRSQRPSALLAVAVLALATGCGAAPERIGASGIDELVIPTPDPSAADFVAEIDNPYLPLRPGAVWVYETTGPEGGETITVSVLAETKTVQGVRTTVVHEEVRDETGEVVEDTYDWFAQDLLGNVWSFGEATTAYDDGAASAEDSWQAGVDGAEAGLAMAAVPRVGDGYAQESLPGFAEDRASVLALDGEATVPTGEFQDLVITEESTPLEPAVTVLKYYALAIGLVLEESASGPAERAELVSFTAP